MKLHLPVKSRGLRNVVSPIFYCYGIAFLLILVVFLIPGKDTTVRIVPFRDLETETSQERPLKQHKEYHKPKSCTCKNLTKEEITQSRRDFLLNMISRGNSTDQIDSYLMGKVPQPDKPPEEDNTEALAPESSPLPAQDSEEEVPQVSELVKPNITLVRPKCVHWYKGAKNRVGSASKVPMSDLTNAKPILTMFTTLKNVKHRLTIHENSIRNWAKLKPHVIPVMFNDSTDTRLLKIAMETGWEIYPVPARGTTGVPKLKDMFRFAKEKFNSTFYGFSNGDMLYDDGLIKTLHHVKGMIPKLKKAMVIGTRYNVKLGSLKVSEPLDILNLMPRTGKASTWAIDFFLISNCEYPWHRVPDDIVIGRPGYDNFLVGVANQYHVPLIDASCTIAAVHQMGPEGKSAGFKNKDKGVNRRLIGKFNWGLGVISRATFETEYSSKTDNDYIAVLQRARYKNVAKMW